MGGPVRRPGKLLDQPFGLAVDDSGNVYVTGRSSGIGDDYATIKYSEAPPNLPPTANAGGLYSGDEGSSRFGNSQLMDPADAFPLKTIIRGRGGRVRIRHKGHEISMLLRFLGQDFSR